MKTTKLLPCIALLILGLCSCSNSSDDGKSAPDVTQKKYASIEEEAKALFLTVDELKRMPQDVRELRAAGIALDPYITLKDSAYTISITKEEAAKKGIKGYFYDYHAKELEKTNAAIKEANKRGEHIDLPDLKAEYEEAVKNNQLGK